LGCALALVAFSACAAAPEDLAPEHPRGRVYKPGQSIAEARLCSCTECADVSCCDGEPSSNAEEPEFGISLSTCSRCTRRVWTARGEEACSALAGATCCPGSVSP